MQILTSTGLKCFFLDIQALSISCQDIFMTWWLVSYRNFDRFYSKEIDLSFKYFIQHSLETVIKVSCPLEKVNVHINTQQQTVQE